MASQKTVIVVGGGLAGMSAAHTALENGAKVYVIDKMAFCGGNSTKATSGINGTPTVAQRNAGVDDNVEKFTADITDSAAHLARPDLIHLLASKSGPAIDWIVDAFDVDLSLVSRLGGHSEPRTHRGKVKFPGFSVTYAMIEKFENLAKSNPERAVLLSKSRVTRLLTENGTITGVEYERDGKVESVLGAVILASGGYGADREPDSLLRKWRPDLDVLPTTNGEHCTGDGVKMAAAVGAAMYDMDKVQVHPTGLVFPNEPDAKVLFLAAEALRGCGAIMINKHGKRFVDELGRRDYVSGKMFENEGPFRLVLNSKAAAEISWHCKHYVGRGVMQKFGTGAEMARSMGVSPDTLAETMRNYSTVRPDPQGRKYFNNLPYEINDEFHVAIVTPVVHYTMGGVAVDANAQALAEGTHKPMPNLYAAGEVVGGVHGKNRLGGNSLLDCVVYGRQAGEMAVKNYVGAATSTVAGRRLLTITSHINPTTTVTITVDGHADGAVISTPAVSSTAQAPAVTAAPAAAAAAAPAPAPAAAPAPAKKTFTAAEVAKHNTKDDCWCIVNGQVLDVTNFLPDHPGGAKAILVFAGKDATEEFNMLHASNVIEKYLPADKVLGTVSG